MTTTTDTRTNRSEPTFKPSRFCWDTLDREAAQQLWTELVDWVGWLRIRYELPSEIPGCWYRHSRMVEELTALMTAHRAAYDIANTADGDIEYWAGMAAWHTQYLRPFLAHLNDFGVQGCTTRDCTAQPRDVHTFHDIADWVDRDVQARKPRSATTPATISPARMAELVRESHAEPVDLTDPDSGYRHNDALWLLDAKRKVFVAQIEPVDDSSPDQPN
ncbi:hypothetical protein GTV32_22890 [Gordonia sp. SID5947]|uniref:hypothetical protein n=1 Tax=Gordonia sp. SID5947 TaxID=2690315 RepID=UPI001367AE7B|nr:hypothetical protein [Gordonia sp. SID5947]MYR08983.1 hypothetical protein [Gordonia sp. SID5947]